MANTDNVIDDALVFFQKSQQNLTERRRILGLLEGKLGLPLGFVMALHEEPNDWAYIVKLAVSVEAAVTQTLVAQVADERMYEHFSRLNNTQRLKLAHTLGLLDAYDVGGFAIVGEVRNSFAHDVRNLGGSLSTYIAALPQQRKREIILKLVNFDNSVLKKPDSSENFIWLPTWFRILLHAYVISALISLTARGVDAQRRSEQRAWMDANASEIDALRAAIGRADSTSPDGAQ